MTTAERLARALEEAGAPGFMVGRAREGYYDDYASPLAFPQMALHQDLQERILVRQRHSGNADALKALDDRVISGEFDATDEEAAAWLASAEGQQAMRDLAREQAEEEDRP